MSRKTRAGAKAEAAAPDSTVPNQNDIEAQDHRERSPTPDAAYGDDGEQVNEEQMVSSKSKSKKKGKGGKKSKKKVKEEPSELGQPVQSDDVNEDCLQASDDFQMVEKPSPPHHEGEEENGNPDPTESREHPLRRSRRNRRKDEAEALLEHQKAQDLCEGHRAESPGKQQMEDSGNPKDIDISVSNTGLSESVSPTTQAPAEELPVADPRPQQDEGHPPLEIVHDLVDAPSVNTTEQHQPALSPAMSARSSQTKDPIEAMDALEDEIEEVKKILPVLENTPLSPAKPPPLKKSVSPVNQPGPRTVSEKRKRPAAATQDGTTKPGLQRTSSARNGSTSKLASSTQPSALNPTGTSTFMRSTASRPRPSSVIMPKRDGAGSQDKSADYLATKRRPISMQFPTPPPPPKSSKPPTKPTFTLPGEAIAAKLKAAREERLKKEEEESRKRREFKARPIPGHVRSSSVTAVRQTAASRARMSIIGAENENATLSGAIDKGLKRSSTITGNASASIKRQSILGRKNAENKNTSDDATSASTRVRPSFTRDRTAAPAPRTSSLSVPKRQSSITASSTVGSGKRISSLASATSSSLAPKSRTASSTSATNTTTTQQASKPTVTPHDISSQRHKGKEVFNRDKVEKEARERERREKEEKARKAREDAAERSRQLSREFREKQRRKKEALDKAKKEGLPASAAPLGGAAEPAEGMVEAGAAA